MWTNTKRFTNGEVNAYLEGKQIHHEKVIYTLGEWAWEDVRKKTLDLWNIKLLGTKDWVHVNYLLRKHLNWEIAVACLGEETIKKRLSEMK